uniref:Uncharacterized protein n=1 Tax=Triticum urartu TaxID=4572 RepID=A0A8R7QFN7_TRIUA
MPRSTPAATCTARSRSSPASTEPLRTRRTLRLRPRLHSQVYADFHNNTAFNFLISPALHTRCKLGPGFISVMGSSVTFQSRNVLSKKLM